MFGFLRYAAILLLMLVPGTSQAQTPDNCELQRLTEPDRHVLRCTGGLVITLDAAAQIGLLADPDMPPRVIEIRRGSIFIEIEPGSAATQVQARHAIAAVRGTEFAVEETADASLVFVVSGRVHVTRRGGGVGAVILEAGEGIDVAPGRPLQVNTWGQSRVDELLSRFGR